MLIVSKVLIQNAEGKYLLLYRNNHPLFGNELDVPGGTADKDESLAAAAIREVKEETGIELGEADLTLLMKTAEYSRHGNEYSLYEATVEKMPEVTLSWEHSDYVWLTPEEVITQGVNSKDEYLHMTIDIFRKRTGLV